MPFHFKLCCCAAAISLLASCGGGSAPPAGADPNLGGSPTTPTTPAPEPPPELTDLQRLVGGTAPTETVNQQAARGRDILGRSDSYYLSRIAIQSDEAASPELVTGPPSCSGTVCTYHINGQRESDDLNSPLPTGVPSTTVLSRNGITIEEVRRRNHVGYASTLHHSGFGSSWENVGGITARGSVAFGDLTGSRPPVRGAWRGMMSGVLERSDELLLGDATLEYEDSDSDGSPELHAEFSNIANVSRNRAHSVTDIRFNDIRIGAGGTFSFRDATSRIQGGFYGSSHSEAAGVFEQRDIFGAFGALKR